MKNNDTYSKVKKILEFSNSAKDSDKVLIWLYWSDELNVKGVTASISLNQFMKLTTPETITRARRKVVEKYPHLKGHLDVEFARKKKESMKGTFIYE